MWQRESDVDGNIRDVGKRDLVTTRIIHTHSLTITTTEPFHTYSRARMSTTTLTTELAEQLIAKMTDNLVNIKDKSGEFLLPREWTSPFLHR
jgi:hypothetical protein